MKITDMRFLAEYAAIVDRITNRAEIDKIEVRLKFLEIKPYRAYELYFIRDNSEDCFIISLLDFHKEKIKEILVLLKEYSRRKNKSFSAVKERMISGIVEIEDLNI